MPASTWARVPQNTSKIDSTNRMTVSRKDASALRARSGRVSGLRTRGRGVSGASAGWIGLGGRVVRTWLLLIGGSCASVELHGFHERLESGLLPGDEVGRAAHLEEPGLPAVRHDHDEHSLAASA